MEPDKFLCQEPEERGQWWARGRGQVEPCSQLTLRAVLGYVEIHSARGFVLKCQAVLTHTRSLVAIHCSNIKHKQAAGQKPLCKHLINMTYVDNMLSREW